jgi:hypothetical protein
MTSPVSAPTQAELIELARQELAARRTQVVNPPPRETLKPGRPARNAGPTPAERANQKLAREQERAQKRIDREKKRAESAIAREASREEKRANSLPVLSVSANEVVDLIRAAGLNPVELAALAAHTRHMADAAARSEAPAIKLNIGDAVIIARAQHPRYAGKVGIITDLRKVRAFVSVPGEKIDAYAFVVDLTPATAEPPKPKKPTMSEIEAAAKRVQAEAKLTATTMSEIMIAQSEANGETFTELKLEQTSLEDFLGLPKAVGLCSLSTGTSTPRVAWRACPT